MASIADLLLQLEVTTNAGGLGIGHQSEHRWSPPANGKRETVSLTQSAFTALSPPSGSDAVLILPGTAISLTLKGVTGDTGITIAPASNPLGIPVLLPLGATPSIGIANGHTTAQSVEIIWL